MWNAGDSVDWRIAGQMRLHPLISLGTPTTSRMPHDTGGGRARRCLQGPPHCPRTWSSNSRSAMSCACRHGGSTRPIGPCENAATDRRTQSPKPPRAARSPYPCVLVRRNSRSFRSAPLAEAWPHSRWPGPRQAAGAARSSGPARPTRIVRRVTRWSRQAMAGLTHKPVCSFFSTCPRPWCSRIPTAASSYSGPMSTSRPHMRGRPRTCGMLPSRATAMRLRAHSRTPSRSAVAAVCPEAPMRWRWRRSRRACWTGVRPNGPLTWLSRATSW